MITLKEVRHLAKLSRIEFSKKELQELKKDLERILGYVEKLGETETLGIKPISHITGLENVGREDETGKTLAGQDEVLEVVPGREGRWVKVPRIITHES